MKADRHTVIVALGGGVIGDLAGFVAATYARGLPLLMVPTTLLAQVDSSVGGKVGVNHPRAKNIIGAFHQPPASGSTPTSLDTLPPRELRCGLAEVVKYGVIMDAEFFADLEDRAAAILERDPAALRDDRRPELPAEGRRGRRGRARGDRARAVLNFGHTIAHAIEAVAGYCGSFTHGEAVAAGMVAECRLAERLGWIDAAFVGPPGPSARAVRLADPVAGLDLDRLDRGHEPRQEEPARQDPLRAAARPGPRRADGRARSRRRARGASLAVRLTELHQIDDDPHEE